MLQGALGLSGSIIQQRHEIGQQQTYYAQKQAEWDIAKMKADNEARMRAAAGVINMQQLDIRQQEINTTATQDKSEIQLAAIKAKASAELAASESGVAGQGVQRLLNSIDAEAQRRLGNVEGTRQNQINAAQMDKLATAQQTKVNPTYGILPSKPDATPNYLTAALSGLTTAAPYVDFTNVLNSRAVRKSQTSSTTVRNPQR